MTTILKGQEFDCVSILSEDTPISVVRISGKAVTKVTPNASLERLSFVLIYKAIIILPNFAGLHHSICLICWIKMKCILTVLGACFQNNQSLWPSQGRKG